MLYLIGLGLNEKGYSREAILAIKKCDSLYLEGYTVDFPYSIEDLEKELGRKVQVINRTEVESNFLIKEAKTKKIGLLVYGSPLFATTHMTLLQDAKTSKVKTQIIYNASVFDAVLETGLHAYKFGKIASLPAWKGDYRPMSFVDLIFENQSIGAHSLILVDIGMSLGEALRQLEQAFRAKKLGANKLVLCSRLGTSKSKICYDSIKNLSENNKVKKPF